MTIRNTIIAFVISVVILPAAFASSGSTWVGGEIGFESHAVQSTTTRTQMMNDSQAFRRNPLTADGGAQVGGELGYVPHRHTFVKTNGVPVHADQFAYSPARSGPMSDAERQVFGEQYLN